MTTTTVANVRDRQKTAFAAMKGDFEYKNPMQSPRLVKAVVSVGVGSVTDKKRQELIGEKLALITGQKSASRLAKKSIASFKVREGQLSGYQVTLRGARMQGFLGKLINVALPRTKDFRGVAPTVIDEMGNATIGIKESGVFPEVADQDVRDSFGFAVTIVTTAKSRAEAAAFLAHLGLPFKVADAKAKAKA
ncbi:MAG TPA: 50S ribosomal protein L5 [Candidatus Paceibacterota bacterium]